MEKSQLQQIVNQMTSFHMNSSTGRKWLKSNNSGDSLFSKRDSQKDMTFRVAWQLICQIILVIAFSAFCIPKRYDLPCCLTTDLSQNDVNNHLYHSTYVYFNLVQFSLGLKCVCKYWVSLKDCLFKFSYQELSVLISTRVCYATGGLFPLCGKIVGKISNL